MKHFNSSVHSFSQKLLIKIIILLMVLVISTVGVAVQNVSAAPVSLLCSSNGSTLSTGAEINVDPSGQSDGIDAQVGDALKTVVSEALRMEHIEAEQGGDLRRDHFLVDDNKNVYLFDAERFTHIAHT